MPKLPAVIICDLGGVFVKFAPYKDKKNLLNGCAASPEEVEEFFLRGEEALEYERGKVSSADFFAAVQKKLGYGKNYEEFKKDLCANDALEFQSEAFDFFFKEIKSGYDVQLWLLSNLHEIYYEYLNRRWPGIFSNCLRVFLSFRLGCRKPEPEIYRIACAEGGVSPHLCVFIDDLEENGAAAAKQGISFVRFQGIGHLREALKRLGMGVDNKDKKENRDARRPIRSGG